MLPLFRVPAHEGRAHEAAYTIAADDDAPRAGKVAGGRTHFSPFVPSVSHAAAIKIHQDSSMARSVSMPSSNKSSCSSGDNIGMLRIAEEEATGKQRYELEERDAPEKVLTLLAMRLALLEKMATSIGTLAFIWATVVLLSGFASVVKDVDFWFVTVILLIEGARIFSRSHEVEWQHLRDNSSAARVGGRLYRRSSKAFVQGSRKLVSKLTMKPQRTAQEKLPTMPNQRHRHPQREANMKSGPSQTGQYHLLRTWSASEVPFLEFMNCILNANTMSGILYWTQIVAACIVIIFSVYRLVTNNFPRHHELDTALNHTVSLFLFYSSATLQALIFLLERGYWEFQISGRKILVRVNEMCGLSKEDLGTIQRFFYEVYSQCLKKSIFEGLKMDLVNYAITWLHSDIPGEQLAGLRMLRTFSLNRKFTEETLRSLSVRQGTLERLLEMITWGARAQQNIRKAAADLLSIMVKDHMYSSRVAAIPGSIGRICSLLVRYEDDADPSVAAGAEYTRHGAAEPMAAKHVDMYILGLRIFKQLAKDPLMWSKIGLTRGLLPRLVSFIDTNPAMLGNLEEEDNRIILVRKSLALLNTLASATGSSGKVLREIITRIVYTISNLHTILEYGQKHLMLKSLATEILCSLAMDEDVRVIIGRKVGVMYTLASLFLREAKIVGEAKRPQMVQLAGVTLALLVLKNKENCLTLINLNVSQIPVGDQENDEDEDGGHDGVEMVEALMGMANESDVGCIALSILRSLCAYSGDEECKKKVARGITSKAINLAMKRERRTQEEAIGLLALTVKEVETAELGTMMGAEGLTAEKLAAEMVGLLQRNPHPSSTLPRLRRHIIDLAIALSEYHSAAFLPAFRALRIRSLLRRLANYVSDLEDYATFSGVVGVTAHEVPMSRLFEIALSCFRKPLCVPP